MIQRDSVIYAAMIGWHGKRKRLFGDNSIRAQLKPEFNVPYKVLTNTFEAVIYVLIFGMLFTYMCMPWYVYLFAIILVVVVKMMRQKEQYKSIEYNFYATRLEYKEGFYNRERLLEYECIREIVMTQNILERLFGIGTIRIFTDFTKATNSKDINIMDFLRVNQYRLKRIYRNSIPIHCLTSVHKQYELVKRIINEGTE